MTSLRNRLLALALAAGGALAVAPAATADVTPYIAGGRLVEQAPWAARVFQDIGNGYVALCTGALISDTWVLTARHCLPQQKSPEIAAEGTEKGDVWVYVGKAVWSQGKRVDAKRIVNHENVDIGLIELKEPATGTESLPLADRQVSTGDQIQLYGYGATKYQDGPQSPQLKVADAEVENADPGEPFIVSRGIDGGVLPGDSGGPTVRDGQIIAVHSVYYLPIKWRQGDTSTVLPDRRAWIKQVTGV